MSVSTVSFSAHRESRSPLLGAPSCRTYQWSVSYIGLVVIVSAPMLVDAYSTRFQKSTISDSAAN